MTATTPQPLKNPGIAAVLSVPVPGLGHLYNGNLAGGFVIMVIMGFLYFKLSVGADILAALFILHAFIVSSAYRGALKFNRRMFHMEQNTPVWVDEYRKGNGGGR